MANTTYYMVAGNENADPNSERRFYDTDSGSGYPYATPWIGEQTTDIIKAVGWLEHCKPDGYAQMCNAQVVRVEYVPVDITKIESEQVAVNSIVAGLSANQRAMLKKELS